MDVSIGLAGCGAGIAGLINLSEGLRGAAAALLPWCNSDEINWPHVWHLRELPTTRESRGDGACIEEPPVNKVWIQLQHTPKV